MRNVVRSAGSLGRHRSISHQRSQRGPQTLPRFGSNPFKLGDIFGGSLSTVIRYVRDEIGAAWLQLTLVSPNEMKTDASYYSQSLSTVYLPASTYLANAFATGHLCGMNAHGE